MFRRTALSLALAITVAGLAPAVQAQSPSRGDARFVRDAAAGGQAEVALGQLALQKGSSPQVKQFAERMVAEHGQANQELLQLASSKGIAAPAQPTSQQRRDAALLGGMSGDAFDHSYARQMVADHRTTVTLFEREARSGRDPELKAFATRLLPSLRDHLQQARALGPDTAAGAAGTTQVPLAR